MKKDFTIGVLGGMGTYATIHFFEQYAEVFQAEKEWERPRIIIDNRCTMPSRVRALLYDENVELLVDEMTDSIKRLVEAGCTRIILACNTSHLFLPAIYERVPEAESKVLNIIDNCVEELKNNSIKSIYLLASEGTIDSKIYQKKLEEKGIECIVPDKEEYLLLRECIEAVKQNKYSDKVKTIFLELVKRHEVCILGCTELPVLHEKYLTEINNKKVYDPLMLAISKLKKEYDCE